MVQVLIACNKLIVIKIVHYRYIVIIIIKYMPFVIIIIKYMPIVLHSYILAWNCFSYLTGQTYNSTPAAPKKPYCIILRLTCKYHLASLNVLFCRYFVLPWTVIVSLTHLMTNKHASVSR